MNTNLETNDSCVTLCHCARFTRRKPVRTRESAAREQGNGRRTDDPHSVVKQCGSIGNVEIAKLMGTYSIQEFPNGHHEVPPTAA
jgi:hypothetical protein